ncbi:MAG: hypothetical protein RB296_06420 [Acidobacteriota bacterium]|nr:hypothetical protein [Acidobacteriota bacterium]
MKPRNICLVVFLALAFAFSASLVAQDLDLGNIRVPRAFVHGETSHDAGIYHLVLTDKEGIPWFQVQDRQGNLLFEEMGVVLTEAVPGMRRAFRMRGEMLRGYEFYRVRVTQPDRKVLAYFLLRK